MKTIVFIGLHLLCIVILLSKTNAEVRQVGVGQTYQTLNAALTGLTTNTEIVLKDSTISFSGASITLNYNVVINSSSTPYSTILCPSQTTAFLGTGSLKLSKAVLNRCAWKVSALSAFTLEYVNATNYNPSLLENALTITDVPTVTILNSNFMDFKTMGGVLIDGSNLVTISDSLFTNITGNFSLMLTSVTKGDLYNLGFGLCVSQRGALFVDKSIVTLDSSAFLINVGGGAVISNSIADVMNSYFFGNGGSVFGGAGLVSYWTDLTVYNSIFEKNIQQSVYGGAGILIWGPSSDKFRVTISSCFFLHNNASSQLGGGVLTIYSNVDVFDSVFDGNYANAGGALHYNGDVSRTYGIELRLLNNTFMNNQAAGFSQSTGGAIYHYEGISSIFDSKFINNSAAFSAGAFISTSHFLLTPLTNDFDGCIFEGNNALFAPAVQTNETDVSISNSVFDGNSAQYFGALYATYCAVSVSDSVFKNNYLYQIELGVSSGAAIWTQGYSFFLSNTSFVNHTGAWTGGAIYYSQISTTDSPVISDVLFQENSAFFGGGMSVSGAVSATGIFSFFNTVFTRNSAKQLGGGLYAYNALMVMNRTSFYENKVTNVTGNPFSGSALSVEVGVYTLRGVTFDSSNAGTVVGIAYASMFFFNDTNASDLRCFSNANSDIQCDITCTAPVCDYTGPVTPSTSNDNSVIPPPKKSNSSNAVGIGVGVGVGVLVLLAILGVLAFIIWRKRARRSQDFELGATSGAGGASHASSIRYNSSLLLSDVKIEGRIGGGNFGEVYAGTWNETTKVALKCLKGGDSAQAQFEREAELLFKLVHPNIVRALGIYRKSEEEFFLVLEFCKLGALDSFLQDKKIQSKLDQRRLLRMCLDVAAGCKYMEQKGVIHRDLGARNLLVTEVDGDYSVKISDLGLSREANYYTAEQKEIPYKWSSPETIKYGTSTSASDVWSFGVVMWEIFSRGERPYQDMSNKQVIEQVANGLHRLSQPEECPDELYGLMTECWNPEPALRPKFSMLFKQIETMVYSLNQPEVHVPIQQFSGTGAQAIYQNSRDDDNLYVN